VGGHTIHPASSAVAATAALEAEDRGAPRRGPRRGGAADPRPYGAAKENEIRDRSPFDYGANGMSGRPEARLRSG